MIKKITTLIPLVAFTGFICSALASSPAKIKEVSYSYIVYNFNPGEG
jgi:hypothetical protein